VKYLIIALAVLAACDDPAPDTAEVVAIKAQCRTVLQHIVQITPQGQGTDPAQVVAALPVEDLQGCVASEPEIRDCMGTAADVAAVKKCLPGDDVLGCMRTAAGAKKAAREKAGGAADPARDRPFDEIRAKCWAGDPKAADGLNKP
jgi:hypothetical protein